MSQRHVRSAVPAKVWQIYYAELITDVYNQPDPRSDQAEAVRLKHGIPERLTEAESHLAWAAYTARLLQDWPPPTPEEVTALRRAFGLVVHMPDNLRP